MRLWITPRDMDGFRIEGVTFSRDCGWNCIAEHVAKHLHCDPDDIDSQEVAEGDDCPGYEWLVVKGKRVGYLS